LQLKFALGFSVLTEGETRICFVPPAWIWVFRPLRNIAKIEGAISIPGANQQ